MRPPSARPHSGRVRPVLQVKVPGGPDRPPCGRLAALAALVAVAGCTVGPRFVAPTAPRTDAYTPARTAPQLDAGPGEPGQRLSIGRAPSPAWWERFGSPTIDALVRRALAHNPTLDAARATLAQAEQVVRETRAGLYPQIDFGATAQRQKGPAFALGLLPRGSGLPQYDLYSVGPTVRFAPDVFGLNAHRIEEREALADVQREQVAAAVLAITGNTVTAALDLAALHTQIEAIRRIVADDERALALARHRFSVGRAARTDVLIAEARLASDRARLPGFRRRLAATEDALAVLLGESPAQWTPPAFDLSAVRLPTDLPLVLPSRLVRRRPDILASESIVHARSAAVGIATGELVPQIEISGAFGTSALAARSLFGPTSAVWSIAAGLSAPVFHGGALEAQRRAAVEALRASLAMYRATVLAAFGQVADTLRSLGDDAAQVRAAHRALAVGLASLRIQRARFAAGRIDRTRLIDAERTVEDARVDYTEAIAEREIDSARLFVALGGAAPADRASPLSGALPR